MVDSHPHPNDKYKKAEGEEGEGSAHTDVARYKEV